MVSSLAVLGSRKDLKREMSLAKVFGRVRQLGGGGSFFFSFFFFFFFLGWGRGEKSANLGATWIFARMNLLPLLCLADSMCSRRISDFSGQVAHCPC